MVLGLISPLGFVHIKYPFRGGVSLGDEVAPTCGGGISVTIAGL